MTINGTAPDDGGRWTGLSYLAYKEFRDTAKSFIGLAMVGLYGLVAYTVSRRTREIGIRMVIGAQPGSVLGMVMRHGTVLVTAGAAVGLLLTVAVSGLLRSAFPSDAGVQFGIYALVVPVLLVVTLLAAFVPALRAARIDPLAALRQD